MSKDFCSSRARATQNKASKKIKLSLSRIWLSVMYTLRSLKILGRDIQNLSAHRLPLKIAKEMTYWATCGAKSILLGTFSCRQPAWTVMGIDNSFSKGLIFIQQGELVSHDTKGTSYHKFAHNIDAVLHEQHHLINPVTRTQSKRTPSHYLIMCNNNYR